MQIDRPRLMIFHSIELPSDSLPLIFRI